MVSDGESASGFVKDTTEPQRVGLDLPTKAASSDLRSYAL